MKALRLILQILLPLILIALGVFVASRLLANAKKPVVAPPVSLGPLVRTLSVAAEELRLDVRSQGSVEPLRTVEVSAEVGGRIVATHPELRVGGAFTENDVLLQIDPTDYELQITQQEAAVARAELRLSQERAEAEAALRAWQKLEGDEPADELVRRVPQIKDAELAVAAAQAMLAKSRLDLLRCKVQLPFAGRVRSVAADLGQTVQRGQRLAVVLDTSAVEVPLPIPLEDAAFLALPIGQTADDGPEVMVTTRFAGRTLEWRGRIVRTEGEVDRKSRQLTVIARVGPATADDAPPLLVGMFVEARIVGRSERAIALPRAALLPDDSVWVVEPAPAAATSPLPNGAEAQGTPPTDTLPEAAAAHERRGTLRHRPITVLRTEADRVVLARGLADGELVCLTRLDVAVDGMQVRVATETTTSAEPR